MEVVHTVITPEDRYTSWIEVGGFELEETFGVPFALWHAIPLTMQSAVVRAQLERLRSYLVCDESTIDPRTKIDWFVHVPEDFPYSVVEVTTFQYRGNEQPEAVVPLRPVTIYRPLFHPRGVVLHPLFPLVGQELEKPTYFSHVSNTYEFYVQTYRSLRSRSWLEAVEGKTDWLRGMISDPLRDPRLKMLPHTILLPPHIRIDRWTVQVPVDYSLMLRYMREYEDAAGQQLLRQEHTIFPAEWQYDYFPEQVVPQESEAPLGVE